VKILLAGIGNPLRGDDAAGIVAVRGMSSELRDTVTVLEVQADVTDLIEHLQGYDVAIIVDATRSGSMPGTIHRFDASATSLVEGRGGLTTHGMSVGSAIELARKQGAFPRKVLVFGIEASQFIHGAAMSPEVKEAIQTVHTLIKRELDGSVGVSPSTPFAGAPPKCL